MGSRVESMGKFLLYGRTTCTDVESGEWVLLAERDFKEEVETYIKNREKRIFNRGKWHYRIYQQIDFEEP